MDTTVAKFFETIQKDIDTETSLIKNLEKFQSGLPSVTYGNEIVDAKVKYLNSMKLEYDNFIQSILTRKFEFRPRPRPKFCIQYEDEDEDETDFKEDHDHKLGKISKYYDSCNRDYGEYAYTYMDKTCIYSLQIDNIGKVQNIWVYLGDHMGEKRSPFNGVSNIYIINDIIVPHIIRTDTKGGGVNVNLKLEVCFRYNDEYDILTTPPIFILAKHTKEEISDMIFNAIDPIGPWDISYVHVINCITNDH